MTPKEYYRSKLRDMRILISDGRKAKHKVSKDALYDAAIKLMNTYFKGQSCINIKSADPLTWTITEHDNRMDAHPVPKLAGI